MKTNIVLYWVLTFFFAIVAVAYTVWSLLDPFHQEIEWVGSIALLLLSGLFGLIAYYLGKSYRSQGGELVEDLPDSTIDDGDPEVGEFSPWSWWPITLGASIALVFLGIAVGTWIVIVGFAASAIAVVGWVFEYYRGAFGR